MKQILRMRTVVLLLLPAFFAHVCLSQVGRDSATQSVKNLIGEIAPAQPKVRVLFRSLVSSEGKLAKFDDDSFYLKKGRNTFALSIGMFWKFAAAISSLVTCMIRRRADMVRGATLTRSIQEPRSSLSSPTVGR